MVHDFTFLHRVLCGDPLCKGGRWEQQGKDQDQAYAEYRSFQKVMGSHTIRILDGYPSVYILMLISSGTKKVVLLPALNKSKHHPQQIYFQVSTNPQICLDLL